MAFQGICSDIYSVSHHTNLLRSGSAHRDLELAVEAEAEAAEVGGPALIPSRDPHLVGKNNNGNKLLTHIPTPQPSFFKISCTKFKPKGNSATFLGSARFLVDSKSAGVYWSQNKSRKMLHAQEKKHNILL